MDPFALIVIGGIFVCVAGLLLLGFNSSGRFLTETLNKNENMRWAAQLEIEQSDIPRMLAAANSYRSRRGLEPIEIADFQRSALREQRRLIRQADKHNEAALSET